LKKGNLEFGAGGFEQGNQTNKETRTEDQLWGRVITGRLVVSQLVKKFPAFYET
jgi:hypothetical protein